MANILFRTRGNANPKGKPRVYFTCHPADFEKYFDKVCEDIFKTHDCAIYYTEDMTASIAAEDLATDLGSNNLFVIPVTFKLLTQPNRAMDEDFPYAQQEHIPVLPFMMEPGMDMIYSRPDKFGKLQYLNPCSTDTTEISYEKKLGKFLESVLISDELAKRVRAAFDAYIFLSYRKKDRRYANELMRMIHRNPECRDIAIWYDEFLTPGESFQDSIEKILHSSKLFTLLVTPNLLEEPDGKPNFVMAQEYPAAKEAGIQILPAEMEATDKTALDEKFAQIPDCVDTQDETSFRDALLTAIKKAAITTNDSDPEHNFLIGLAYLEGIDVETDRERGLELITSAAKSELPEAMEKLYTMYTMGLWVPLNYSKAAFWLEALVRYYQRTFGEEHRSTLIWMDTLSFVHIQLADFKKANELANHVYTLQCRILGEEHPDCIDSLNHLAISYDELREYKKALALKEKVYALQCKLSGEESPKAITLLSNLALTHSHLGKPQTALPLAEKAYALHCKVLGEEHPDTIRSLSNLASTYKDLKDHKKCVELNEKAYTLRCRILGETHPYTLISLNNLAAAYSDLGDYEKALELKEKNYTLHAGILGKEHPNTLLALSNLAIDYYHVGDYSKAMELEKSLCAYRLKVFGENHPDTHTALSNLVYTCIKAGDFEEAASRLSYLYSLQRKSLGASHPATLDTLGRCGEIFIKQGKGQQAVTTLKLVYTTKCSTLGQTHPKTILAMRQLSMAYENLGKYTESVELNEKIFEIMCKTSGTVHPNTLYSAEQLASAYESAGSMQKAVDLWNHVYAKCQKLLSPTHPNTNKISQQLQQAQEKLAAQTKYQQQNLCRHCGGSFTGLFRKKCSSCGKPKDY